MERPSAAGARLADGPGADQALGRRRARPRGRRGLLGRRHRSFDPAATCTVDDVIRAYEEQIAAIEAVDGRIILMASRALVRAARSADDYARVYQRVLSQVRQPVIIHWLGDMFDPALAGYWGTKDLGKAMDTAVAPSTPRPPRSTA